MKTLDLNKTVYELTEQYPELIEIMSQIGFEEITIESNRNSLGKMQTIPGGVKMKGIDMMTIVSTLMQHGFTLTGEKPTSNVKQGESHSETIKSYLKRLNEGDTLEHGREDFVKNFSDVEASEIMKAEQELINEGTDINDVTKLCDVHSSLFHGATREERIENAEKEVIKSSNKAFLNSYNSESLYSVLKTTVGHPLYTFDQENRTIELLIEESLDKEEVNFYLLKQISIHYAKKGDLLYPLLKVKYEINGPSDVMWGVDDEIRDEISYLDRNRDIKNGYERLQKVLIRAKEMVYKEDNILLPICSENFTNNEWIQIYKDSKDYKEVLELKNYWAIGEKVQDQKVENSNNEIVMPGGHLTLEQLTALLNTVPIEITFVDDQDMNRYFNEGPKVFKRPQMAIDREVYSCHPPRVEPMVRAIIEDFKNGERDSVDVWMEKEDKPFLVRYMAVRDSSNKYIGTVEVVQDMSFAREHFSK